MLNTCFLASLTVTRVIIMCVVVMSSTMQFNAGVNGKLFNISIFYIVAVQ